MCSLLVLSHVSLGTNDAPRAAAFYDPVLVGLRRLRDPDGNKIEAVTFAAT